MGSCYSKGETGRFSKSAAAVTASPPTKQQGSARWRKKEDGSKSRSVDQAAELNNVAGSSRMFMNGATKFASLYTQQGKKGTNQDAMLVWENLCSRNDTIFCGVFDGHGPYGHMVAKKVRDSLPLMLCTQWNHISVSDDGTTIGDNVNGGEDAAAAFNIEDDQCCQPLETERNHLLPDIYWQLKQSMLKAFKLMDNELKLHSTIDCFCSGSTAVILIKQGQDLVIGNVGDSRAVLASRDKENSLVAVQLTIDLKPDLPREAARIQQFKGRVFALQDEPEVARVWLPNNDSPGLAMARAFGDFCLKDFGLISTPDIFYHCLTERDEFVILATDGVWDVLSNKEAVDIVASAPSHATAARALVDCATRAWRLKYPTSKNDDCAVVCLFLDRLYSSSGRGRHENGTTDHNEEAGGPEVVVVNGGNEEGFHAPPPPPPSLKHFGAVGSEDEIVPVIEPRRDETLSENCPSGQIKKSLAECISVADDDEWSALEGITRVNSLLSLPRFLSGERRSGNWRKWL